MKNRDEEQTKNQQEENAEIDPETQKVIDKKKRFLKETKSIGIIIVAVLIFRSVFFEPFRIPSGSMIPTLMIGDFILVNKFSYGFKVPFSDLSISGVNWDPIYLFGQSKPERGDVVVFKYPKDPTVNYVKRVVGLPGDKISIKDKQVYINGEPIEMDSVPAKKFMADMDDKFLGYNLKFYEVETGDHEHIIQFDSDSFYKTDYEPRTVPKGKYFVMGDNRYFSYDSRFWGFVPFENIRGEAILVWFSMSLPFGENTFKFRPWRIGEMID